MPPMQDAIFGGEHDLWSTRVSTQRGAYWLDEEVEHQKCNMYKRLNAFEDKVYNAIRRLWPQASQQEDMAAHLCQ